MIAQTEQLLQRDPNVANSLLSAIFAIFSQWRLTGAQQMTLLGLSNEKILYNWKGQPGKARLTRDLLERTSYILGIYKSLQILLPDQTLADQWLTTPNDNPLFNGMAVAEQKFLQRLFAEICKNFCSATECPGGLVHIRCDDLVEEPLELTISECDAIQGFELFPEVLFQRGSITDVGAIFVLEVR